MISVKKRSRPGTYVKTRGRDKLSLGDHANLAHCIWAAEVGNRMLPRMLDLVSGKVRAPVVDRIIKVAHDLHSGLIAIGDALQEQMFYDHAGDPRANTAVYFSSGQVTPAEPAPSEFRV